MKIGAMAKATGTRVETIRYYEREGLLPETARSEGNFRVYTDEHVQRLAFIRHCRSLSLTLDEIRKLLRLKDNPGESCAEANCLLAAHIELLKERIREFQALEAELKTLQQRCHGTQDAAHCGILKALSQRRKSAKHGV